MLIRIRSKQLDQRRELEESLPDFSISMSMDNGSSADGKLGLSVPNELGLSLTQYDSVSMSIEDSLPSKANLDDSGIESKSPTKSEADFAGNMRIGDSLDNRRFCWVLLSSHLQAVALRLAQYSNEDLTISIARMLLSVPRELIDIPILLPAIERLFSIGLSHYGSASFAMDVLEKWHRAIPEIFELYIKHIVPMLQDYLSSSTSESPCSWILRK